MIKTAVGVMIITPFALFAGLLGTWISERDPPVQVISRQVLTKEVTAGERLKIKFKVIRHKSCSTTINRVLFDGDNVRFTLFDESYAAAPGPLGEDEYISTILIPHLAAHGDARLYSIASYECNGIHKFWPVVVQSAEIKFKINEPIAGLRR